MVPITFVFILSLSASAERVHSVEGRGNQWEPTTH